MGLLKPVMSRSALASSERCKVHLADRTRAWLDLTWDSISQQPVSRTTADYMGSYGPRALHQENAAARPLLLDPKLESSAITSIRHGKSLSRSCRCRSRIGLLGRLHRERAFRSGTDERTVSDGVPLCGPSAACIVARSHRGVRETDSDVATVRVPLYAGLSGRDRAG